MSDSLIHRLLPRHLGLIRSIADKGQISLAANALAITQPAASRMLAEIERMVGSPVFIRTPKGMEPTPVGSVLARRAHTVLEEIRETAREVEAIKKGHTGVIRLGAVTGGAVGYVVPAMRVLKEEAEDADFHVDVAPSDALIADLLSGHHDFVLGRVPWGTDARQFALTGAFAEDVDLLVHRSHPLANAELLPITDLVHFPWVMQAAGAPVRRAVEAAFISQSAPIPPNIVNTTSLLVMIAMLASSNAVAPMSREVSELLCQDARVAGLTTLKIALPIRVEPYHLIEIKGKRLSPLSNRMKHLLLEEYERRSLGAAGELPIT
ncbi:LysR family transcriptional regulator [Rhizobium halophytocola]|uniref:DNA-binding transcriptional LysR family regulator n=1 Tax=Rhizobium halophytocola TaxID=735519 RepID=A0ABS4E514_9HYPH|nr:LysR family transcriptional regulator [Rhizobium halophytocola]MBP1853038.1 DNA-binding transcriptional LysR family regulator [Rhizobium halophytocola]